MNTQCKRIVKCMLMNRDKNNWKATDFQHGEFFIGYEASARMSDLIRMFPKSFKIGKDERYRTLSVNWEDTKDLESFIGDLYGN